MPCQTEGVLKTGAPKSGRLFLGLFFGLLVVLAAGAPRSAHAQDISGTVLNAIKGSIPTGILDGQSVLDQVAAEGRQQAIDVLAANGLTPADINTPSAQSALEAAGIDPGFITDPQGAATSAVTDFLQSEVPGIPAFASLGLDLTDPVGSLESIASDGLSSLTDAAADNLTQVVSDFTLEQLGNLEELASENLEAFNTMMESIGLDPAKIAALAGLLSIDNFSDFVDQIWSNLSEEALNALLAVFGDTLNELLAGLDVVGLQNLLKLIDELGDISGLIDAILDPAILNSILDILNSAIDISIEDIIKAIEDLLGIDLSGGNCDHCGYCATLNDIISPLIKEQHEKNFRTGHESEEFEQLQIWLFQDLWMSKVLPAMMMLTDQITNAALQQAMIIGTMLDAKTQLETQALIQQLQTKAHKDYHPSAGVCEVGTNIRSLAASEERSDFTKIVLSRRGLDRELGVANANGAGGPSEDLEGRREQFIELYCNPHDFNNVLADICPNGRGPRINKDIDYARTVDKANTLNIDFMDQTGGVTEDEEDVFALASNLYSHDVFTRIPPTELTDPDHPTALHSLYMDARSVVAKRSVAENSYNAIVALKAEGSAKDSADGGSREYMRALLQQLAIPADQIDALMGANPSYYAQMDVLTRKIYQNPDFYIALYDQPANVARKRVALRAIALMQDRDILLSQLRTEAMLSVLTELSVMDEQKGAQGRVNAQTAAPHN